MTRRQAEKRGWALFTTKVGEAQVVRAETRRASERYVEVGAADTVKAAEQKCLAAVAKIEARWARRAAPAKPRIREGSVAALPRRSA